jgi:carboxypeptidase Taq
MRAQAAYEELLRRAREEALLASCAELLAWDEVTYMPRGGALHRANQLALLAGLEHARATDPRRGELLSELQASSFGSDPEAPAAVNLRELRRRYDRLTRLPRRLVEELARVTSVAEQVWAEARCRSNFERFRPWLEQVVSLKREEAEALGYEDVAYDALLEEFEPGARSRQLTELFDDLRRELVPLAEAVIYAPRRPNANLLRGDFPIERQRRLGEEVAAAVGYDFAGGRLDTTPHPFFSNVGPGDCRITARFDRHDFCEGFFTILHEIGHAFYEQGLDPAHFGTPLGEAASLGMHEAQARLWENMVGRRRSFWVCFLPRARAAFPEALDNVTVDAFHFAVNAVAASPIRVHADELTYNLHVLIRFELERALLAGDLRPADLPGAWNEAYRHHLGVTPANNAEGCLQDSHWSAGQIGYFPTYTLGHLFAAQLFACACNELGDVDTAFSRGDFAVLRSWLHEKVYRHGQRYSAARLMEQATGRPPDPGLLVRSLRRKFSELYGL